MKKRPLCLMVFLLMAGILLARFLGISWIWRSPGGICPLRCAEQERKVSAEGTVYQQEVKIFENQTYTYLYLKQTNLFMNSEKYPIRNLKCILKQETETLTGCRLCMSGTLTLPKLPKNPGEFDRRKYEQSRKIDFYLEDARVESVSDEHRGSSAFFAGIRQKCMDVLEKIFPQREAGVLEAMLLGEKKQVEDEVKTRYQYAGISHVIAISGLHITLLGMAVWNFLKRLGVVQSVAAAVSFSLLAGYGILIGNPTTAMRALLMFGILMGAKILGRAYDLFSALAAAGILLLLDNPDLLADCGFQLSFMAVLGMGSYGRIQTELVEKLWKEMSEKTEKKRKKRRSKIGKKCRESLVMGVSLWLFTLPVVLRGFSQVSVVGIFCNLLVIPLMPAVLGSGAAALTAGLWNIRFGSIVGISAYGILRLYERIGTMAEAFPFGVWTPGQPSMEAVMVYYIVMAVSCVVCRRLAGAKKHVMENTAVCGLLCMTFLLLFLLMASPWKNPGQITVLDVGQGDGLVVQSGESQILIDGGSSSKKNIGSYVILPYLKQQGISRLEGIFLTHTDEDHVNGVREVLEEAKKGWLRVEYLFMPKWMEETETGKTLINTAKDAGVTCRSLKTGDKLRMGEMNIKILHPGAEDFSEKPNEGSLVFTLEIEGVRGMFTGDLPMEEEQIENLPVCDFLKAGHHGSNGSSSEIFLEKVHPESTLISCGENNRYGHPGKETVKRLQAVGSRMFRTDRQGAITVKISRNGRWKLYGYCGQEIFLAQSETERYTE